MQNPALSWLAGALLNAYGQLVLTTSWIRVRADPAAETLVLQRRVPVIYALWHCHVFFMPLLRLHARRPVAVLLSSHRDARIVGVAARMRGVDLVPGSSTRGGLTAYRRLLQLLRGGQSVCITPDGPRGPARQVKQGVLHLARQSGCAVVPVGLALTRRCRLRSWDRSVLPLPFGRAVLALGAPLYVPGSRDRLGREAEAAALASALEATSREAALLLGPARR
ncbi:lysophospholipid acyltransferase family protein [Cyanobium sp. CH-040]|uniref:lysophospholipid acyltransferase family protein n=1 Tax=Cyanobium sp. CH-040 TaxID=2823708 RepID=UPI0020CD8D75|nr:lysophospholipid acyltransferase family protein [Cyanobium sp. CH-040]MCP9927407.1 lysophospholipid acyltransferase family protein [Cyanobium sp. CH-040]